MNADRTELIESRRWYLNEVIRAARLKTMAALAKKLDVTQSTLSNVQKGIRSAGPELIEKIRRLAPEIEGGSVLGAEAIAQLSVPTNQLRRGLGDRLAQGQRERIQELQGFEETLAKNTREVVRNFEAMDQGDVFIYLSAIQRPLEMDHDETVLKESIASAIMRQAFFLYLRPTTAFLERVGNYVNIRAEFDAFKSSIFSKLPPNQSASFAKHLLLIQADENPLFVAPDFKWELFYSDRINAPHKAAAGALIASGGDPNVSGPHIRIPLTVTATKRVLFEVAKTICLANPGLKEIDRVPSDIVARLKASAEAATGGRITDD